MRPANRLAVVATAIVALIGTSATAASAQADDGEDAAVEVAASQQGVVMSARQPVGGASVLLMEAGSHLSSASVLGSTTSDGDGSFTVEYRAPSRGAVLYLVVVGSDGVRLATVLGQSDVPASVVVNERTTVATAFAMAQFIRGTAIGGSSPGLPNAAGTFRNLVGLADGGIGDVLATRPNGRQTTTRATLNSLANMLASCVRDSGNCDDLFDLASPAGGRAPTNTLDAMVNIAHDPGANVVDLLALARRARPYRPDLPADAATNSASDSFVNNLALALRYDGSVGNRNFMDGPGNIAFDSEGKAWVNNNYAFRRDTTVATCGSTLVNKLGPTGEPVDGSPFGGNDRRQGGRGAGGLYGAGYGMAVDVDDHGWVTNFGFQGQPPLGQDPTDEDCQQDAAKLAISASEFTPGGTALSRDGQPNANEPGGYIVRGYIHPTDPDEVYQGQPQGILSDRRGDIWFAGCVNGTLTRFPGGNPRGKDYMELADSPLVDEFDKGFDVAIDHRGHAWVTGNGSNNVVEVDRDFAVVDELGEGRNGPFDKPMGIAADSAGNMWVSSAALPNPPCPALLSRVNPEEVEVDGNGPIGPGGVNNERAAVTLIDNAGDEPTTTKFGKDQPDEPARDGLRWPWGIAVDGNDTVWVANFSGRRIMQLCGAREDRCRGGAETGDPLSPDEGYYFGGLERVTAVQVDPSGNLWATNNWVMEGFSQPENPGGYQVVVFVGLARPVRTPMLGPVEPAGQDNVVERVAGPDRVATSIELSSTAFATADAAVLARAGAFPDALSAAPLAIAAEAPVLLNPKGALDPAVADELERLGVATVYLAGGAAALSDDVADALEAAGFGVVRLAGENRVDTAAVIATRAARLTGVTDDVLVARADQFADALSASNLSTALGAPLVLTGTDQLAAAASDAITAIDPDTVWIIGGEGAISATVASELAALGPDVQRLGGANRYDTAGMVLDSAHAAGLGVMPGIVASGANYPDALSAGPAAATLGGQLMLANPAGTNTALLRRMRDEAQDLDLVYIAGGPAAVPTRLDPAILTAITAPLETP